MELIENFSIFSVVSKGVTNLVKGADDLAGGVKNVPQVKPPANIGKANPGEFDRLKNAPAAPPPKAAPPSPKDVPGPPPKGGPPSPKDVPGPPPKGGPPSPKDGPPPPKGDKRNKLKEFVKKNPLTTTAAAAIAVYGATVYGKADASLAANNNKKLKIILMVAGNNSGDVIITYSPDARFVDDDQIEIDETSMIPSHKRDKFDVLEIISPTKIRVNIPDITTYAHDGTIILKTTLENRLEDSAKDVFDDIIEGASGAAEGGKNILGKGVSGIFEGIKDILGPYITVAEYSCYFICFLIIVGVLYTIYTTFNK